jgi:hypothetical protein
VRYITQEDVTLDTSFFSLILHFVNEHVEPAFLCPIKEYLLFGCEKFGGLAGCG